MGMTPAMGVFMRYLIKNRQEGVPVTIGLVADQTPPWHEIDHWYDFFNRPTPFFPGMEKIACRFNVPVYFVNIERTRRAHYNVRFELLYDGIEEIEPHVLTQRYADRLEVMIRHAPQYWMWSHRRWKRQPK